MPEIKKRIGTPRPGPRPYNIKPLAERKVGIMIYVRGKHYSEARKEIESLIKKWR